MTIMRFNISPHEAERILESLPMPREWWREVAQRFLELYYMTPAELQAVSDRAALDDGLPPDMA